MPNLIIKPMILKNRHEFGDRPRRKYRIELKFHVPNRNDAVYFQAREVIRRYNQGDSFEKFANPLWLEAVNAGPTWFYDFETAPEVHAVMRFDMIAVVQLKLKIDTTGLTSVLVANGAEGWVALKQWLPTLPAQTLTGKGYHKLQWQWWQTITKTFRLMDLPKELREIVMLYALGKRVHIEITMNPDPSGREVEGTTISITQSCSFDDPQCRPFGIRDTTLPDAIPATNMGMLYLNKDLRARALDILRFDTTKCCDKIYQLQCIIKPSIPRDFTQYVRRLELSFTNAEYRSFFGVRVAPFNTIQEHIAKPTASILLQLPHLQRLDLFFRSTITLENSAWAGVRREDFPEMVLTNRYPCQKPWVAWVMTFAFKHIRHIPKVILKGYVKTESKKYWEGVLNHGHDVKNLFAQEIQDRRVVISKTPTKELPPHCFCSKSCFYGRLDYLPEMNKCAHGPGDRCDCAFHQAKRHDYRMAYDDYAFDFDDTAEPVEYRPDC